MLQKIQKFTIAICLLCSLGSHAVAQFYYPVDTLTKKFNTYRRSAVHEKIYVQTDRASYLTGETMWFKFYLVDASLHKPLGMSDVAYLEIIDRDNQPVLQTKVGLTDGQGNGSLYLPASITSGNFTLRAYTTWMRNFGPEYFFQKTITIVNTFKKLDKQPAVVQKKIEAQFFPEGGTLVAGVNSKIAFRITDSAGKGKHAKGFLLNGQNDTLTTFEPLRFGLGHFKFTPLANSRYRVLLRDGMGKYNSFPLPDVEQEGYSLQVTDSLPDKIVVHLQRNASAIGTTVAYVLIHARHMITHAELKYLKQHRISFTIDKATLADGISQITVFDASFRPLCERLYFTKPRHTLTITAKSDQSNYPARRSVKIDLQTAADQVPYPADVAVSVYKVDSLDAYRGNINEYLWLTSDLTGHIEQPDYYLTSTDPSVATATDNLMLTHGWRRFAWDNVLSKKLPVIKFIPEYQGHMITGMVYNPDGSPAQGIMTYLASPGKITRLYGSLSNQRGEIHFEMQKFAGASSIILQTNPKRDSVYRMEFSEPFSDKPVTQVPPPFMTSESFGKSLLDRSVAMQVQDIYYRAQQDYVVSTAIDSTAFYGAPDEKYLLDAFNRFPVMEEVMREYVPGVIVRKRKDGFHFLLLNDVTKSIFNETPLIMLDGVPIFDEDEIMNFSPLKVRKLEVVTRRYYLGPLTFPGIVSYTTYTGDLDGFPLNPKSIRLNYEGLQLQREFYSPSHEGQLKKDRMPDQRTLLYWNPQIKTDANGKAQVSFYTSDQSGLFRITVEGITRNGQAGYNTQTFVVHEPNN